MEDKLGLEVLLSQPYEQALETVTAALKTQGFGVLTRIDVRETMKEKLGADFRPYAILGACNPPLALRALSHTPEVGLLLPCNVTVEEVEPGKSLVRLANPGLMVQWMNRAGDEIMEAVAAEAEAKIRSVAKALEGLAVQGG